MKCIGIDPGRNGAIALYDSNELAVTRVLLMPYDGKELDCAAVRDFVLESGASVAALERQHSMPKQGVSSIFTTGESYGCLRATLVCCNIPYITPLPSRWLKSTLTGVPGDGKGRNIAAAKRLFPSLDLTPGRRRKPHDGIADAALLAYYAHTQFRGK